MFSVCITILVLIDDITDRVDGTTSRVHRETRHIETVERKSASCGQYSTTTAVCHRSDMNC